MRVTSSTIPARATDHRLRIALILASGAVVGALAQVADGYQHLSEVASRGGIWFAMLVAIGMMAGSSRASIALAAGFGLMSLVGYYVMTALDSGWAPPWTTVWFWSVAAVTLAVSAVANWTWHGGHSLAWVGFGILGGLLLGEAVDVLLGDSSRRAPSFVVALLAGVAILIVGYRKTGRASQVLGTALVAAPVGWLALRLLEIMYRGVIGGGLGSWL